MGQVKRDGAGQDGATGGGSVIRELDRVLAGLGLEPGTAVLLADAALLLGAVASGDQLADARVRFVPTSVRDAEALGLARPAGEHGAVGAGLGAADRAQTAIESLNQLISRLEAARLTAAGEGLAAIGRAELASRGVRDPGELSATARERWRARVKSRFRQDLGPATGWSQRETATFVAVSTAPAAFWEPAMGSLARGTADWPMVRGLWRACDTARLSAADASHVAEVMLGDDPARCVPERREADGSAKEGPWGRAEFWSALDREVVRLAATPDPEDETSVAEAARARAARDAAYAARSMRVTVGEDGTAQLILTGSVLTVVAIGDRLDRAARAARGDGDPRTVVQLASDIGLSLLKHATLGAHAMPDLDIFAGREVTPEDLAAAGWTPQIIAALSAMPPAVLQVVVPLLALHDPATAHELPTVGQEIAPEGTSQDTDGGGLPGSAGEANPEEANVGEPNAWDANADESPLRSHTGRPGCPGCLPSARVAVARDPSEELRCTTATQQRACEETAPSPTHEEQPPRRRPRVAWVGRLLGKYPTFLTPDQVRALALVPGSTVERLLVNPADGRCVERSVRSYSFDPAMRAQLAAADVTCRAPGCLRPAAACQADHVQEHGTPGGQTRESNGQLVDVWHHDPKTAKAWDAVLHDNRDVTWTTTLSRVYRTRVHDYRELVTVVTDAMERVSDASEQDRLDQLNLEVCQALCYRGPGERLNEGDDDAAEEFHLARFGGWAWVSLVHRDPATGRRAPGPSRAGQDRAAVAAALARPAHVRPEAARVEGARTESIRGEDVRVDGARADGARADDVPVEGARPGAARPSRLTVTRRRDRAVGSDDPIQHHRSSLRPPHRESWERRLTRRAQRLMDDESIPPF